MEVCIVSSEFLGPVKNTGIGTVTSALARQLAADGHGVTLLYTYVGHGKPITGDIPWEHWVEVLAVEGITLDYIPHDGDYRAWREASWLVKKFIGQSKFDLVYFNDHLGSGYYSLLAKRSGLAPFCNQLHCVITHGSMEWIFNLNDRYAHGPNDIEWMGLERRSVEMADVVIAPSTYLLREYESYGWQLPAQTFHQPYPIFQNATKFEDCRRIPISEIVFFGRLETRKGLWLFCEALDRLAERFPRTDVTFLGKVTEFSGMSSALQIVNRSARWPFRVRLLSDFDQVEALAYLRKPGRLAVMPSLADNSPCAVYECMEAGIPFVSTRGSGVDELVDQSCWDDVMVQANVKSLTEKIAQILEHGARLGRPRFDPAKNLATWSAWHRFVADNRANLAQTVAQGTFFGNKKAALVVIIDSGACALSLLIDNLSAHIMRFAGRAAYLVLSSRRGELQDALLEIFSGAPEGHTVPLCVFDERMIEEARSVISGSEFVFFADAETEIMTSFFLSALDKLQSQERAIVSCVVSVRRDSDTEIEDLPTGDIPGLAAMGEPVGGSTWAVSAARLADDLSSLEYYDAQLDELAPSWALGQLLMQRCRTKGVPIHVIPIVGALETRERGAAERRHISFEDTRRVAAALGIMPSVYKGGPPWFAISAFGGHVVETAEPFPIECSRFLPPEHPCASLRMRSSGAHENPDLPELAAALGRAELSLQLEAASGPVRGRVRHLTDVATRATRLRPAWDLTGLLARGEAFEFGLTPVPKRSNGGKKSLGGQADGSSVVQGKGRLTSAPEGFRLPKETTRAYVDARRLRIRQHMIQAVANLRLDGSGKMFMVDVPLCGHAILVAKLRSSSSDPLRVDMKVIDQGRGGEMGASSARLIANRSTELTVALQNVYGRAMIAFEFSGAEKMEVTVESLRIE